jgi:hypothetical protein
MQSSSDETTKAQIKHIIDSDDKSSARLPMVESGEAPQSVIFKQEMVLQSKNNSSKTLSII